MNKQYEYKKEQIKHKVKRFCSDTGNWIYNNREMLQTVSPIVIAGLGGFIKITSKVANNKKTENLKNNYCYDRSLGHYWKLKRELSNAEWLRVEKRRKLGEKLGDILEEMRVLK